MMNSSHSAQAPLLAELRYPDFARELWPRLLLRVRQLGANTVFAPVPWAWHAPSPDLIDLDHGSDPRHDLLGFIRLCSQLGLDVILDLSPAAGETMHARGTLDWLSPTTPANHTLATSRPRHAANLKPEQQWIAACSGALLPHQIPHGPIAGLLVAGDDPELQAWLRQAGWRTPLFRTPAHTGARIAAPPAKLIAELGYLGNLAGEWPIRNTNGQAPTLLRSDMSARPGFWRAKAIRMLLGAAGGDFAAARAPADLALVTHAGPLAGLAEQLACAGITFDQLDLADATAEQLQRYRLVIAAGATADLPAARETLAGCANLALVGAPARMPAHALQLTDGISADQISELIETSGGYARYAWADSPAIDVELRYGAQHTYLFVHNRHSTVYNGMLTYRAPHGDVLHLHLGIGAGCSGIVMLDQDEVVGAALDGDGSEGGWLARGLTSSMTLNAGAGGIAPCGSGLLITGPQSARFQIRRSAGWAGMRAYRLLLSGELIPARLQIDAAHMLLPYVAEDARGQTDMYFVLADDQELPDAPRDYLAALLRSRAAEFEYAAELAHELASAIEAPLRQAARALGDGAESLGALETVDRAWRVASAHIASARAALEEHARATTNQAAPVLGQIYRLIAREE